MKNSVLVLTSVALTMVYSCGQKESTLVEERFEDVPLTVKATMADKSDSKTVFEDGNVLWTSGDAINLFFSNQSSGQFTTNIDSPAAIAEFTGTLSVATGSAVIGTTGKAFWAVYPYNQNNTCDGSSVTLTVPSVQASLAGSFADKLNPSVATSPGLDLAFYNVCAPFYFSVTQSGVTSATFRGNNDEDVAGKVRVTMDPNGFPVSEVVSGQGAKSITINAPDGGFVPGTTYVLVLLPQTLSAGYTLTLHKGNAVAECVVSKNAEFIRSQGRSKMNADDGLTYVSEISGIPMPEAIDLGLSVKWASFNIGASAPEEYGDYYAWGELNPYYTEGHSQDNPCNMWESGKTGYNWESYIFCDGSYNSLTKYNTMNEYGYVDNKTVLDAIDDVASVKLGGEWRLPTVEEIDELLDSNNCAWEEMTINDIKGFKITSKKSGFSDKWIFLPSAGDRDDNYIELKTVSYGCYWSSSIVINDIRYDPPHNYPFEAFTIDFSNTLNTYYNTARYEKNSHYRWTGCPIRPVAPGNPVQITSIQLSKSAIDLEIGDIELLTTSFLPDNATLTNLTWTSADTNIATVTDMGEVTAIAAGSTSITAFSTDCSGISATCEITVLPVSQHTICIPEAVDLGLSVKWANFNVGASTPEECGDYYAWGDTEPYYAFGHGRDNPCRSWHSGKTAGYVWATYKWNNGAEKNITKYCTNSYYGIVDDNTILAPEDDVAHVKLGDAWRMPTREEANELINNCTRERTTLNGVDGMMLTSKQLGYTDKWIFFPFAGYRHQDGILASSSVAYLWTSELLLYSDYEDDKAFSWGFNVNASTYLAYSPYRQYGLSVRPVLVSQTPEIEIITDGTFTGDYNSLSMTTPSGITISQLKNKGTSCSTSYNTINTLRVYRYNQLQFTGKIFKSIEMYYKGSYSGYDWAIINGGGTVEIDTTNKKVVWENTDGASVVTLQNSTTNVENVQLRTTEFVITYE